MTDSAVPENRRQLQVVKRANGPDPRVHTIPENRLLQLRAGVATLNKRATKLGLQPVKLVVIGEPRSIVYTEVLPAEYQEPYAVIPKTIERHVLVVDVRFDGEAPRVGGFTFVARLDHQEGGNLVLRAPGVETDLDGWRLTGSRCQHCGLDRKRSATFLLQNEQGALIQVGKSCLEDYTGSTNIASAVELFKCWQEILVGMDEGGEYGFGGSWQPDVTPVEYVAAAVSSIRRRGFHKSGTENSTRSECDFLTGPCPQDKGRRGDKEMVEAWKKGQPSDAQREEAAVILAWTVASKDSTDYMHNARIAAAARVLIARTEGLLASLPVAYDKAQGIERERLTRPAAGPHVGAIGERLTTQVTVRLHRGYENDFGRGVMILMFDENNSAIKTFSSGRVLKDQENFDGQWHLRAVVKKHDKDSKNGEPVTLVKRVVLQREAFAPVKPTKVKPASKGAALWGYKTSDAPNSVGAVAVLAHEWLCPRGVEFSWAASLEGTRLHEKSCKEWLSRVKPPVQERITS